MILIVIKILQSLEHFKFKVIHIVCWNFEYKLIYQGFIENFNIILPDAMPVLWLITWIS